MRNPSGFSLIAGSQRNEDHSLHSGIFRIHRNFVGRGLFQDGVLSTHPDKLFKREKFGVAKWPRERRSLVDRPPEQSVPFGS